MRVQSSRLRMAALAGLASLVFAAATPASAQKKYDTGASDAETIRSLLETLRQVDSATAREAMQHATNVLATAFAADKVDAFFKELAQPAPDVPSAAVIDTDVAHQWQYEDVAKNLSR